MRKIRIWRRKRGFGLEWTFAITSLGRLFRFAIAFFLLGLAYNRSSWILAIAGLFVLYESIAGWCILVHFLGKKSCPK